MADNKTVKIYVNTVEHTVPHQKISYATLIDCEGTPPLLFVVPTGIEDDGCYLRGVDQSAPMWLWHRSGEAMPPLPGPLGQRVSAARNA